MSCMFCLLILIKCYCYSCWRCVKRERNYTFWRRRPLETEEGWIGDASGGQGGGFGDDVRFASWYLYFLPFVGFDDDYLKTNFFIFFSFICFCCLWVLVGFWVLVGLWVLMILVWFWICYFVCLPNDEIFLRVYCLEMLIFSFSCMPL